ncbi:hypothetical protein PsYK624_047440 [Phanerochaete sordida]|uniref:Uncharacterized protein n=1 Tax=Phanerochaete sordida TaxID=48140 RepID=A0A9P3LAQ1_9APHY|nr:hypothetical protein PsYK624_047440 [Phanerochaete sordida]
MFSKIAVVVVTAAVAVSALPAPMPLPAPLPANNNGTRNYTIGNTTYFNQTTGAEAACARGIKQWCNTPTKRSFEPVVLRRAPLPLPEPLPANNNGTRNVTVGNTTYFNQTNGAEAACARGIQQWCNNPAKRSVESVALQGDVGVDGLNSDATNGTVVGVHAGDNVTSDDVVNDAAVNDSVDTGVNVGVDDLFHPYGDDVDEQ